MNVIRRIVMVGVVCAFFGPALASAQDDSPDYGRFGPYVGVNAAIGYPLFEDNIKAVDPTAKIDYGWGLNARAGVRLLSWMALEGQYEWIENFDSQFGGQGFSIEGHTATGNLKLFIPIQRFQPYLLAGIGGTWYTLKADAGGKTNLSYFAGRFGGGFDVYLNPNWALNAEVTALITASDFEFTTGSFTSLHYLSGSLGLMYRF